MDDLISRQDVLDIIRKSRYLVDAAEKVIRLPSAQPGRWIPHQDKDGEHYGDECSECGEWYVMPFGKSNFCPNCGANMRGKT